VVVGADAASVQDALDLASPGDTVVLPDGRWPGPAVVTKAVTLRSAGGTLVSDGTGTTLRVEAAGAQVTGLTIAGSGHDLQGPDACIYVAPSATGARIVGNTVSDCLFGIWLHEVSGVHVVDNQVGGLPELEPARRGNGIHLFDSEELTVQGNTVRGARDGVYVSATEHSLIADNVVSELRFGIHYMYSYDNEIRGNIASHNIGGLALMGSHRLKVHGNIATDNERQGILFRDVQYCDIYENRTSDNAEGLFFFSSLDNDIHDNHIQGNDIGARVWAGTERNRVWGNHFVGNRQQVFYVAAHDQEWGTSETGNYWSDYQGWDQDGDGRGDRPYRVDSLTAALLQRYPPAALLLNSPALELVQQFIARVPSLRVPSIVDPAPQVVTPSVVP